MLVRTHIYCGRDHSILDKVAHVDCERADLKFMLRRRLEGVPGNSHPDLGRASLMKRNVTLPFNQYTLNCNSLRSNGGLGNANT
jgi:hypothetical protein